jgi:sugar phosphate isomerase/epimerase
MSASLSKNKNTGWSRRAWISTCANLGAGTVALPSWAAETVPQSAASFRFCLNTATIRGQNLDLAAEIEVAAKAGYNGIEPWLEKVQRYAQEKGGLKAARQMLEDHGLAVECAIGFPSWAVEDEAQRTQGLEQARRDMDHLAQLGGKRMAAPPAGIPQGQLVDVARLAERYRTLLELGERMGVLPVLEFWGRHPSLGKLSTAVAVAVESGHPNACVLGDVFHMYRGGSSFTGLRLLGPIAMPVLHLNDYPANPPRGEINDSHRVMPGDGVAPLAEILRTLRLIGARPVLSLELFNRDYWKQDALTVAKLGLKKIKAVIEAVGCPRSSPPPAANEHSVSTAILGA